MDRTRLALIWMLLAAQPAWADGGLDLQQTFRSAAEAGDPVAQHVLGSMHRTGQGAERSSSEAVRWYQRSARQGYAPAQLSLGEMYGSGTGVESDVPRAYMWVRLAARQNLREAVKFAEEISLLISDSDRTKSDLLLAECLASASLDDC